MKDFAELIEKLDSTNKTNDKVRNLSEYFINADDKDKVWTIAILSHKRPPRPVNTTAIRKYAAQASGIPDWLFDESYHIVGDLAETVALLVQGDSQKNTKKLSDYLTELIDLRKKTEEEKRNYLYKEWSRLNFYERFVFTKLFTGGFRIGISQKLMTRALSNATNIDEDTLAYRLMGNWKPSNTTFHSLIMESDGNESLSRPYPFYLCYQLENKIEDLGKPEDWSAEYKWDGIRAQLIKRKGKIFLWSRGEELITDKYPEVVEKVLKTEDDFVLDGELIVFKNDEIRPFQELQKRIGRKNVTTSFIKKYPVTLRTYDLFEINGKDCRTLPFSERRKYLEEIVQKTSLQISELIKFKNWSDLTEIREKSREVKSEGLMLKSVNSEYGVGRKKGNWWKWKVDPVTIDAVLTYAMRGHGRRSNLFTDYTFGLWGVNKNSGQKELITFAKAYSGLSDAEFRSVDQYIKNNTIEKFGPVRSVVPKLVFELAFEGIAESSRHKSGYTVRFPRIKRWRKDKKPEDANTLEDLKSLI